MSIKLCDASFPEHPPRSNIKTTAERIFFKMLALNENIKKLRTSRGLNQVEFAKTLGISKQCVSNWENDNVMPSIEMLVKMANFFKVSTDSILGRNENLYIDVSELSDEQISHITLIINDISKLNKKP